jgi:DNA-directed RNA polymerase subunit K/omega
MSQYIQDMIDTKRGKYLLVNAVARRVRALQSGSKVLVNRHSSNPIDMALEELKQGKIQIIDKGISIVDELEAKPDKHAARK